MLRQACPKPLVRSVTSGGFTKVGGRVKRAAPPDSSCQLGPNRIL